jgi:hypothetical protein
MWIDINDPLMIICVILSSTNGFSADIPNADAVNKTMAAPEPESRK